MPNPLKSFKRTPGIDAFSRGFCRTRVARDTASLDLFWLRDASMTDLENLPEPDVLAEEIMENLRSTLASFEAVGLP